LRKRASIPFEGALSEPIEWKGPWKAPGPTASEDLRRTSKLPSKEFRSAQRQKLELLKKYYRLAIWPLSDFDPAMRLAIGIVPGFKMANPVQSRGRNPQRPGRQLSVGACAKVKGPHFHSPERIGKPAQV